VDTGSREENASKQKARLMRFAAMADVHGNYLALEAVIADIRAQGIEEIVNLGDMASGPLDARRTMDALMALDAVHVLGNHDRCLIDRPPEKMGSWDRPAHAQLDQVHQKGRDQIRAILTPEQRPKFEEFLKNLDQQKKHSGSK